MTFVLQPDQVSTVAEAGGKALALARLAGSGAAIPPWFVVSPDAFAASLTPAQQAIVARAGFAFDDLGPIALPDALRAEIASALWRICPDGAPVAVRSSAAEEDSRHASFAGQFESFLDVAPADVPARILDVWRSGFSARLHEYRRAKGLPPAGRPPAALVQRLLQPERSGVAFSRDPMDRASTDCVVSVVAGRGERLVLGEEEGSTYRVAADGTVAGPLPAGAADLMEAGQVRDVAALAQACAAQFGLPQDIEWAIAEGRLWLLQSRPITTFADGAAAAAASAEPPLLWDNSNIVESYSGVTSPLTFSFARRAYEGVYRQFLRVVGVSRRTIARHDDMFPNMLGYVQGRVYYNLANWYRLIALLPGFALNRRYMEQMMGVSQPLPAEWLARIAPPPPTRSERLAALPRLAWMVVRILGGWLTLGRSIAAFLARIERALAPDATALDRMSLAELGRYYRRLERELGGAWEAPILNDFYTMIAHGLSRHLLTRWLGDQGGALHNAFLRSGRRLVSAEPARLLVDMAQLAAADPALCAALAREDRAVRESAIAASPAFATLYRDYLGRFGDRCIQELKLESPTLADDPAPLLRTLAQMAMAPGRADAGAAPADPRQELGRLLRGRPLRLVLARWLVAIAKRRIHDRETLRFERTRVFGRARRIFLAIGGRLAARGLIDTPRDIFFLEVAEVLGLTEGTATTADIRGLVALRRADERRYRASPDPPNRFETAGPVAAATIAGLTPAGAAAAETGADSVRRGLGCSPGVVRARVSLVTDPASQTVRPGEILAARHTDPGWVLLFGNAAGVLVERGSLLSHSAIVARELGLPAVVSLPGLMEWLADGDEVEIDGTSGEVRRLGHAAG